MNWCDGVRGLQSLLKMQKPTTVIVEGVSVKKTTRVQKKKSVLIIYTGGTMGMRVQSDGTLAPEKGYLTERINETSEMHNPDTKRFIRS